MNSLETKMINSNQRIFNKLQSENSLEIKKRLSSKQEKKQTKSVRLKFWDSDKKLFLGMNKGFIETISKPEEFSHLTRDLFINIKDVILSLKYLSYNFEDKNVAQKNILTIHCPTSIWLMNIQNKKLIGGGRLDKRLENGEKITSVFVVHEGRVLCVFTDHSQVLLLLIRKNEGKIELVFLEKSPLEIKNITGQNQFGK
jgi:hypothetical protein